MLYQAYTNREHKNYYFLLTMAGVLFYLFMDCLWLLNLYQAFSFGQIQSLILNCIYFVSIALFIACWYIFALKAINSSLLKNKIRLLISFIPLMLLIVAILTTYWTHWIFSIDSLGYYHRQAGLPVFFFVIFCYVFYLSFKAIYLSKKTKNYLQKQEYIIIFKFAFFPFITAVIQMLYENILIFNVGLTYSIFIVYNYYQQNLISLDPLTKINNRQQLEYYLINKMNTKNNLYLFLLDIDNFKTINDHYGHVVGDQVILKTVDILKQISHNQNCFLSRYGGDEFVLVCQREQGETIQPIFDEIKERLMHVPIKNFEFSVSIGYAKYDSSLKYIPDFIEKADQYMYLNKKKKKHSDCQVIS